MNTSKIGKFIAEKRKEKNLTQKELADILNITDRAVSKWERGIGCPDISIIEKLSNVLGISVVELLRGEKISSLKEENIIETLKTSSEITKNKLRSNINIVLVTIIIFISSVLLISNIKISYSLHKEKYYDFTSFNEQLSKLNKYYQIIQTHQGKYSNEDYKIIKEETTKIKEKIESFKFKSDYYNINEYYKLYKKYKSVYMDSILDFNTPYRILIKYDVNIYKNMLRYYIGNTITNNVFENFEEKVLSLYKYTNNNLDEIYMSPSIISIYTKETNLFKDIIEVGELDA